MIWKAHEFRAFFLALLASWRFRYSMKALLRFSALLVLTACGSAPYPSSHAAPAPVERAKPVIVEPVSQVSENEGPVPIGAQDPVWGSRWAPVTIVEFADFECSFCERAAHTLERLEADYGPNELRIVWKNDPLGFHPDARALAEAGQGVFAMGGSEAFWKFHRAAYAGMKPRWLAPKANAEGEQALVSGEELSGWVQGAGVNGKAVLTGLDDHKWSEKVAKDVDLARDLGVGGTPAFFINGVKLEGARPIAAFREIIDAEAEKARAKASAGTVRDRVYLEMTAANRAEAKKEGDAEADADDPAVDKTIYKVPVGKSPASGPPGAPITLVEFSDFECPFCKHAEPTVKALTDKYKKDLRVVWKNNPLPFHKHAMPAAGLALEALAEKGVAGFWAAHDKLFERSPALEDADLEGIGRELHLEPTKVHAALDSPRNKARIDEDQSLADDLNANGTPAFFVNGRRIMGAQSIEVFDKVIGQELERARAQLAKGTAPAKLYDLLVQDGKTAPEPERKTVPPKIDAPMRGAAGAKVTIVEFSDFQCPFCQRVTGTVDQIMKDYDGKVKLVFRHLPLPFHANAHLAAEAAAEVYRQKGGAGFFKMHDLLFANQSQLDRPSLERYAGQLGVDMERFGKSLDAHDHGAEIDADAKVASESGISGTPGFVINGYYLSGAQPYRSFKRLIERALAEASAKPSGKGR